MMSEAIWVALGGVAVLSLWKAARALCEIQWLLGRLLEVFGDSQLGTRR
jgi:hypothetical protein